MQAFFLDQRARYKMRKHPLAYDALWEKYNWCDQNSKR